jgi:AraC-like DNA-binding protein
MYQVDKTDIFYDKLHQHEEIQLSYIIKGTGTLIVGDTINTYNDGDIFVIGSHIPHVFKSIPKSNFLSHMRTIFFTRNSFGESFFNQEAMIEIASFFERTSHGFRIESNLNELRQLFIEFGSSSKFSRFLILLNILHLMVDGDYSSLSSFTNNKKYRQVEGLRMRRVFEFVLNNYTNDIKLKDVSEVANMTKNAFCKYFRRRTGKTFIEFLNELRVEHAIRELKSDKGYTIAEIAFRSGFSNISNFNKTFKKIKNDVPSAYLRLSIYK